MKIIDNQLINLLTEQATVAPRKRKNYNFHETLDAVVQRMLNAMEPDTYVQPHKHENPDKVEAFIILRGRALVVMFDDRGNVVNHYVLSAKDGVYGIEISPRTWHTILSLEPGTVVYEAKEGPYKAIDDKNFASWAPKESDPECAVYNKELLKRCGL
jgi:cupin fold WbuC family metalloprotein